jgi:hypothetical protein
MKDSKAGLSPNVIITGISRSGTTRLGALADEMRGPGDSREKKHRASGSLGPGEAEPESLSRRAGNTECGTYAEG